MKILVLIAVGAALYYFYLRRKDDKRTIAKQDYELRRLKGIKNAEDELENKNLIEDHHFKVILQKILVDDNFKHLSHEIQLQEAKRLFKNKYGYSFSDPFNEY